jgi:hypothetical protein
MSATDATTHVEEITALLEAAPDSDWTPATPAIRNYWDDAQSERGPGAGQPGVLYLWSPTDSQLETFSMDGTQHEENTTVEIQVWSLDPQEARQLQADVTRIIGLYIDNNAATTPYSTVEPTGQADFREQKPARNTDHYVMSVTVETTGLSETREVDETAFESTFDATFG